MSFLTLGAPVVAKVFTWHGKQSYLAL